MSKKKKPSKMTATLLAIILIICDIIESVLEILKKLIDWICE